MTIADYYRHARSLANFRAIDCINLARQAMELDRQTAAKRTISAGPDAVSVEVQANCEPLRLSRSINVF